MAIKALRWLLFLPAAMLGGLLVYIIFEFLSGRYIDPGSIFGLINILLGGALSGAAAVYIAAYVAPCCEEKVAIGIAVLTLIVIVFTIPLLKEDSISYILFYISQNIGIFYMAWRIFRREVTFDK